MPAAPRPLAIFRADASRDIGAGHVMRCLALADELAAQGWTCRFAVGEDSLETAPALTAAPHDRIVLPRGADAATEARLIAESGTSEADWLIVDHYGRDAAFERACRSWARRILAIDDLADRPHDCDLLLDQTSSARAAAYDGLLPAGCRVLAGPSYALLRPQFAKARSRRGPERASGSVRVFVSFGGVDAENLSGRTLDGLAATGLELSVDIVIGASAPHRAALERRVRELPFEARLHVNVADMAALMGIADFAVGAAGGTAWERCALGLPSIVVIAADNQRQVAAALHALGVAQVLGDASQAQAPHIAEAARALARADAREPMARAAIVACDGLGARRVRLALEPEIVDARGQTVRIRPATAADMDLVHRWQAAPQTRRFARNAAVPDEATHRTWMERRLTDPGCVFNVILVGSEPAGVLRLDRASGPGCSWEVSIYVDPALYRRGIARAALALARRLMPEARLVAEVLPDNHASHALFLAAGYRRTDTLYELRPAADRIDALSENGR